MRKAETLYRAVWRWHFYAGLFCVPFVIVLALTGSQVSGVGVEVLRNGAIQGFGAANGWQAGTISQGTANFQIDLEARYRQIRNPVSGGGSANALATFTIDYQ